MPRLSLLLCALLLLSAAPVAADSLLQDGGRGSPSDQYRRHPRPRPVYDFKVHDTVTMDLTITDVLEFTKKQEAKRDVGWGAKIKSFITGFAATKKAELPNVEASSQSNFKSDGKKSNSSNVRVKIPAEIIEILPNGDLVLDASRSVTSDEDVAIVRVGGRVNPQLVLNGIVRSEHILDLFVKTDSKGPLSENQKRGFLTRFFDIFKPF